jgi:hypothetical protein
MADVPTVGSVSFSQMRGSTNNTGQGVSLGSLNLHNLNTPQRLGQIATSQTLGTSKRTPPLFSPSSQQGMVGLYSMKLANPYYTGPVIRAQRSLDNSTLDFWADADGALMSATGNTFASWINSDDLTINYTVTNSGAGAYLINGASNPTLTVIRGLTYTFTVNASGHPFWIQTTVGAYNAGTVYSTGVTNAGTQVGTVTWKVSNDAPSTLYYVCQNHSAMNGTINVINKVQQVTANLLTWYDQSQNDMEALKYPPISLGGGTANPTTATLTSAPYGNGSYIYSGSTQYDTSQFVGALFNSSGNFQNYTSAGGVDAYNGSTGAFTGSTSTTVSGSAYTGAWVQIQLPYAIYPTSYYRLMSSGRNETSHVFAGSNNGTTWALLNSATEPAYTTSSLINLNVTASYSYYRLIARSINPANQFGFWSLSQLDVYGRQSLTSSRNALATTASGGNPPLIVTDPLTSLTPYLVGTATANHSAPFVGSAGGVTLYVFPPAPMTSDGPQNITGYAAGGSGNYTASASSVAYGTSAFNAFNSVVDGSDFWHSSDQGTYSNSDATAAATTPGFANGSWLQIQFPSAVTLYTYSIVTRTGYNTRTPYNFYIVGSNNGSAWALVDTQTAITGWSPPTAKTFTIASPILTSFTYFRLVTTRLNGTNEPSLQISNWSLNGSLTAPTLGQAPSSNVAIVLPGTSGNYVNFGATHPAHFDTRTSNLFMEAWVYCNAANGSVNQQIIAVTDVTSSDWNMFIGTDNKVHFGYWAPTYTEVITSGTITFAAWNHVALSWDYTTRNKYVFLNGVASGPTTSGTTGVYTATREVRIGSETTGSVFNGYIRDVRIVQGGIVPTTTFTPAQAPFAMGSPTYAPSMGTTVLALYQQFFANGKYVVYFPNGVATTAAYYGLTFSPQTISGAMIQYRTISNPSTYQTFLAGSTDMSIKYTNNTLLGTNTDFLG